MNDTRWRWRISGALVVLLGAGWGSGVRAGDDGPPALEGPGARGDLLPPDVAPGAPVSGPVNEALAAPGSSPAAAVRAPKAPPPPIVERPTADRPSPEAQWVAGYWSWDPARQDFTWTPGAWRVAPRDRIWVNGRWQRDAQGWARVPGFWSPRQGAGRPGLAQETRPALTRSDWRTSGPPDDHPADVAGPAPDPDAFYVPGHYTPVGDRLTWTPGFWSRVQPGWDWVPARWVRRPDGWDYREGYWARDPSDPTLTARRHDVARPRNDLDSDLDPNRNAATAADLPPAIVESEPGPAGSGSGGAGAARSDPARLPPLPSGELPATATGPGRDLIAEDEAAARLPGNAVAPPAPVYVVPYRGPVVVAPPYGYYYRPGRGPYYDPFNLTPRFVRRLLDRVMP